MSPRTPLHVTFRSARAKGPLSFLRPIHARRVQAKTQQLSKRFHVRVHQYANAGNHLHLLIEGRTREGLQNFLRAMGARIAGLVTGAARGRPFGKFWDDLVFSRIVSRGPDFLNTRWYVLQNHLEALGVVDHDRSSKRTRNEGRAEGFALKRPPPFPKEFEGYPT